MWVIWHEVEDVARHLVKQDYSADPQSCGSSSPPNLTFSATSG